MNKSKKLTIIALTCLLMSVAISAIVSAQEPPWDYSDEAAGWALFGIGSMICFAIIAIWVVFILIAIWVYKDAEKRGSSGALWLIIVIFTGIIGIIIWLVVRPPIGGKPAASSSDRRCPNCGRVIPMDARVCPYCSKKFEE